MALKGARMLVTEIRPTFYIEVGDDVADQIFSLFDSADYRCIDPYNGREITSCVVNTLFIPKERYLG